jgi:hypothetical protein
VIKSASACIRLAMEATGMGRHASMTTQGATVTRAANARITTLLGSMISLAATQQATIVAVGQATNVPHQTQEAVALVVVVGTAVLTEIIAPAQVERAGTVLSVRQIAAVVMGTPVTPIQVMAANAQGELGIHAIIPASALLNSIGTLDTSIVCQALSVVTGYARTMAVAKITIIVLKIARLILANTAANTAHKIHIQTVLAKTQAVLTRVDIGILNRAVVIARILVRLTDRRAAVVARQLVLVMEPQVLIRVANAVAIRVIPEVIAAAVLIACVPTKDSATTGMDQCASMTAQDAMVTQAACARITVDHGTARIATKLRTQLFHFSI